MSIVLRDSLCLNVKMTNLLDRWGTLLASSISTFISMHSDTEIFANNLEKLLDNN